MPPHSIIDEHDLVCPFFGSGSGSAQAAGTSQKGIAFGLEVKCLLPLLVKGYKDPEPKETRPLFRTVFTGDDPESLEARQKDAYELIAKTIRKTGEKAITIFDIQKHKNSPEMGKESYYWDSDWIVKKANSAIPGGDMNQTAYKWVSTEISSPRMAAMDKESSNRVRKVLEKLEARQRLKANFSCDVHVHIGRLDGKPFDLATLKRLATLLWLAEPTLRSIRNPKSLNYHNKYTWGAELRQRSRIALLLGAAGNTTSLAKTRIDDDETATILRKLERDKMLSRADARALQLIWSAATHQDLGQRLSGIEPKYRRMGFNFSAFGKEDDRAVVSPRTVEFRIMEGTVEADLVAGWLAVCSKMAEVSALRSESGRRRFAEAIRAGLLGQVVVPKVGQSVGEQYGKHFEWLMQALEIPKDVYSALKLKVRDDNKV
ncbi:hypothetical protein B0T17DRAFT_572332 [Bombardia bombarda]|uniref:Amidoligase enzyme n=1 Tax=Bombardia bombarda TaxID=252184 RepID=A0AA39X738_9PEZI|nr:hypothetical protein B0T17DRAFT_572332 [Bombardia bombarda]